MARAVRCKTEAPRPTNVRAATMYQASNVEHLLRAIMGIRAHPRLTSGKTRGDVTGTPAGDLFGVPHTGKSFRMMAVDIQTIKDGQIARTFHMENWLSAIGQ